MLCREAHELTTLILARQILVAEAVEANAIHDYLVTLHSAPFDRLRPSAENEATISRRFEAAAITLEGFAALLADLEQRICSARARLDEVRPSARLSRP